MAKNNRKLAVGALLAGAAGYVAGILTAPKSGKETRKDIKTAASKAKTEAEHTLKRLHSDLDKLIVKGKGQTKTLQAKAKNELTKVLDSAQNAKDKARSLLSALHEGDADDKELQKAIKDVNQAITHLRKHINNNGKISK